MSSCQRGSAVGGSVAVAAARRELAVAAARLAEVSLAYADDRIADARVEVASTSAAGGGRGVRRPRPGEFVADELSVVLREQPWTVRCLLARSRRLESGLPAVWAAFGCGDVDAEQVQVIDRVARRVVEPATLVAIDEAVVGAAQTRCPKQLKVWLLRLVVALEPEAFAQRHQRALAERRVSVVQGADGMGYVTGEVSAQDAAAIDATLAAVARDLGADDPRSEQQRRADVFADLLLGRLRLIDPDECDDADHSDEHDEPVGADPDADGAVDPADDATWEPRTAEPEATGPGAAGSSTAGQGAAGRRPAGAWLEVEDIDPDTGELLGTHHEWVDADGDDFDRPDDAAGDAAGDDADGDAFDGDPPPRPTLAGSGPAGRWWSGVSTVRRRRIVRIGLVVPLSSVLGLNEAPGELADRSAPVPAPVIRELIAAAGLDDGGHGDEVLFTRLLTDDQGRLLDTTELGRYPSARLAEAVRLRAGTCKFPTCSVPADRCDLDHHDPQPRGPTAGRNLDPGCRRHHLGKTFAWLASVRDHDAVDWTLPDATHYSCIDDPLLTGCFPATG